jgi:formamidopyrimidine-DNA glycosylase
MPELPEVEALSMFLRERTTGSVVAGINVAAISVLKTFDPPADSLGGLSVTDVRRYGKFIDLNCDGLHFVVHLAKAGWLRWSDSLSPKAPKPGRGPLALRFRFADDSGFDLTEAGTKKRLAVYIVRDPHDVPGIARLGIDPLSEKFTVDALRGILNASGRAQIKGVLRNQSKIAGIGNAYSDEVLHAARLSPFHPANTLSDSEVANLYEVIRSELTAAIDRAAGLEARDLKDAKRSSMRVHGRTGEVCPVCGDTVREVSFADSSLQYCATCQTGGKILADRRMSKLLK